MIKSEGDVLNGFMKINDKPHWAYEKKIRHW